ncbi:MAG: response regulator [Desulfobacterales bacterium]|jgi:CheY-like chemotaxis protein
MEAPLESKAKKGVILLVDDEETIIEVCTKMLQRLGYHVLEAIDGQQAIDIFEKQKDAIDIVLLDMRMPGMNGATVYNRLIKIQPNVKVILFSGYFENQQIRKILKNENVDLIQKPVSLKQMSQKLESMLG